MREHAISVLLIISIEKPSEQWPLYPGAQFQSSCLGSNFSILHTTEEIYKSHKKSTQRKIGSSSFFTQTC